MLTKYNTDILIEDRIMYIYFWTNFNSENYFTLFVYLSACLSTEATMSILKLLTYRCPHKVSSEYFGTHLFFDFGSKS